MRGAVDIRFNGLTADVKIQLLSSTGRLDQCVKFTITDHGIKAQKCPVFGHVVTTSFSTLVV